MKLYSYACKVYESEAIYFVKKINVSLQNEG